MLQVVAPGPDPGEQLILLQRQIDLLLLDHPRVAAEFAQTTQWADEGSNSAIDWIRFNCNLTEKAAGDRIAVGSKLTDLAESSQAMQLGEIGFAHLTVIARTAVALGKRFDELVLLDLARKMSPGKLYYKSMQYRHSVDAKGYALEQADARPARPAIGRGRRRSLQASHLWSGPAGAKSARWPLPVGGLRAARLTVRRTPPRPLDQWGKHGVVQPDPALPPTPLAGA